MRRRVQVSHSPAESIGGSAKEVAAQNGNRCLVTQNTIGASRDLPLSNGENFTGTFSKSSRQQEGHQERQPPTPEHPKVEPNCSTAPGSGRNCRADRILQKRFSIPFHKHFQTMTLSIRKETVDFQDFSLKEDLPWDLDREDSVSLLICYDHLKQSKRTFVFCSKDLNLSVWLQRGETLLEQVCLHFMSSQKRVEYHPKWDADES